MYQKLTIVIPLLIIAANISNMQYDQHLTYVKLPIIFDIRIVISNYLLDNALPHIHRYPNMMDIWEVIGTGGAHNIYVAAADLALHVTHKTSGEYTVYLLIYSIRSVILFCGLLKLV